MFKMKRLVMIGVVLVLLLAAALPAQATTVNWLSVSDVFVGPTCDTSLFLVAVNATGTVNDLPGFDVFGMTVTDANGVPLSSWLLGVPFGVTFTQQLPFGGIGINPITARPVTIRLFDVDGAFPMLPPLSLGLYNYLVGSGAPLAQLTYDPAAGDPNCASLPLVAGPGAPGSDMVPIPAGSVVGQFVVDTPIYWEPRADAVSKSVMQAGKTAWVYGVDASGAYYRVMLAGRLFWVPVGTMGPNPDAVWNNTPLPTQVMQ